MQPDSSRRVWEGKKIAVTVEQWGPNEREIVEHPGAVAIVAVDTEGKLAFVRQPREATRSRLLEIPAGTREAGEEPLATAQRELAEECGLTGGTWTRLGGFWTTPGFTREYMHVFLADGVEHGDAAPEVDEDIEVVMLALSEIGEIEDAKSLAALYLFTSRAKTGAR